MPSEQRYIPYIPKKVPNGHIVVHNSVAPQARVGMNGFRIWLAPSDATNFDVEVCNCGWAPRVPVHYRAKRGS